MTAMPDSLIAVFDGNREPALLAEFFRGFRGVFADVGANDPVVGSQTATLESQGWSGVLIEPLPHLAARLRRERSSHVVEAACGSPAMAGRRLPLAVDGPHSSLDPDRVHARPSRHGRILVDVVTLTSALDQAGLQRIDFLSIDAEGFQEEVLQGFDFARYRPRLILVEDHLLGLGTHRCLVDNGYKLVRRTGLNGWYVPHEAEFPVSVFGYGQLARKYLLGIPLRKLKRKRDRWFCHLRQLCCSSPVLRFGADSSARQHGAANGSLGRGGARLAWRVSVAVLAFALVASGAHALLELLA